MKRVILIVIAAILAVPVVAQQDQTLFKQLTEKYADKSGFSASMLTSDLFDLYLKKKNLDENSPVYTALKKLDDIIVVSQSGYVAPMLVGKDFDQDKFNEKDEEQKKERDALCKEILDYNKSQNYTLFKTEKQLGEDVKVYLKKEQEKITSLALITNSSASTNLVELDGNIDLSTVADLNKALNLKGLENLYKIDNSGPFFSNRVYSTGTTLSNAKAEQWITQQKDFIAKQQKLTQEQRVAMEDQARITAEKQAQMAEKIRQMAEVYGRQPIFLSAPGDTNAVYYINGKKVKADDIKKLDKKKIESVELKMPEKEDDKTEVKIKTKK